MSTQTYGRVLRKSGSSESSYHRREKRKKVEPPPRVGSLETLVIYICDICVTGIYDYLEPYYCLSHREGGFVWPDSNSRVSAGFLIPNPIYLRDGAPRKRIHTKQEDRVWGTKKSSLRLTVEPLFLGKEWGGRQIKDKCRVCHSIIRLRSCLILAMALIEGFPPAQ